MLMRNKINSLVVGTLSAASLLGMGTLSAATPLEPSITVEKQIERSAAQSQQRINQMAEQTMDMSAEYKLTLQRIESLRAYNDQLRQLIESQQTQMGSMQKQMETIEETNRGVLPMMNDMIEKLAQFIELDVPFLLEERRDRVQRLRDIMLRADVSNSEKYRQILEAYNIEMSFGDSVEAYTGTASDSGKEVDFLRIGRLTLIQQSLDGKQAKVWSKDESTWKDVDSDYVREVTLGLRMARNQAQYGLVRLPIPAAEKAE